MLDVFVCEAFAVGALGEPDSFSEGAVVGFAVGCVQVFDGGGAGYAYWHFCLLFLCFELLSGM